MTKVTDNVAVTLPNPVGPPTKWNDQIITKALHYAHNYREYGKNVPTVARLAQVLGITKDRVYKWAQQKDKKQLKYVLSMIKQAQECELVENGLTGEFNSPITKLLLSKHGYHENPQANQGNTGIQVTVNRGSVVLKSGGQTVEIADASQDEKVIEHES